VCIFTSRGAIDINLFRKCSQVQSSPFRPARHLPASQARPALRGFSRGGRARALRAGAGQTQALAGGLEGIF